MKSRLGACPLSEYIGAKKLECLDSGRAKSQTFGWGLLRLDSLLGEKFVRGHPLFGPKSVDPPSLLRRKCQNLKLFWRKKILKFSVMPIFVIEGERIKL